MANKPIYTDYDFQKIGQLLNTRLHNVTDVTMAALAGTLGASNEGLTVWNTDQQRQLHWNGTEFQADTIAVDGDVIFRGVLGVSDYDENDGSYTTGPAYTASGSQYVISEAGTIDITGITVTPSAVVEVGDVVLFADSSTLYVIQRNDVAASEATAGNIRLATQVAVDAGIEADTAVTPATLQSKLDSEQYAKVFFDTVTTTALTPLTVNHGLGLIDADAFTINLMVGGNQISADVESVDADNITIETFLGVTDIKVTIIGA